MRKQGLLWFGFLLLCTSLSWAQSGPDRVCEINVTAPKPGGAKQFEEARKKHNEFHQAEKDKSPILVWAISTGPSTGSYLTAVCGQTWKEMDGKDAFNQRDAADIEKTLDSATASNQVSYFIIRPDLSRGAEPTAPAKMSTVTHYFLKASEVAHFTDSIKRINAAIAQTKYPALPAQAYQLVNGGEGPHYVLVTGRNSWADMQVPQQTTADMLKQAYGNDDKTLQVFRDSIDHFSTEMMDYRADLSYLPAK